MKRRLSLCWLFGLLAIPFLTAADRPADKPAANETIPGFTLKDTQGKPVALADFKDRKAVAVVFIGTECPLVNLYVLRLKELHEEFAPKGVQFLAVNSNRQDSAASVAEHARTH